MKNIKQKVFQVLDSSDHDDNLTWKFDVFLVSLILLNVVALILETVKEIHEKFEVYFFIFEIFSIVIFTIEYILRIWTVTESPRYRHPIKGRLRFAITPIAIIDLLAFLPFYLPLLGIDLRFFRMLRIFRLLRLFKVTRYFTPLKILMNVIQSKRQELSLSLMFLLFMLVFLSCLMYLVEYEAQPEAFKSIPATMWWGVATLTTVGYGDIYPVTTLGRIFGGGIAILGVGFFALPAGILSSGFSEELRKNSAKKGREGKDCPTCGRSFQDE